MFPPINILWESKRNNVGKTSGIQEVKVIILGWLMYIVLSRSSPEAHTVAQRSMA